MAALIERQKYAVELSGVLGQDFRVSGTDWMPRFVPGTSEFDDCQGGRDQPEVSATFLVPLALNIDVERTRLHARDTRRITALIVYTIPAFDKYVFPNDPYTPRSHYST